MSKYVLFDLAGTLTDSSPGIINSILFALNKMGVQELDKKKLRAFVGPSLKSTFKNNYFPAKLLNNNNNQMCGEL